MCRKIEKHLFQINRQVWNRVALRYTQAHIHTHTWSVRPAAFANDSSPKSQRERGVIKVFLLDRHHCALRRRKLDLPSDWDTLLKYIPDTVFGLNSWNLFFCFILNNFDLPNLPFPLARKKEREKSKELSPFMSTYFFPSMQWNVSHMLFLVGSLTNAELISWIWDDVQSTLA